MQSIKPRFLLSILLALSLVSLSLPATARAADKQKTELNKQMEEMDKSFKSLKRTLRSADQDKQSLDLLAKIEALAVSCKQMIPSKLAAVPAEKRDAFVLAYRKEMAHLIADLCLMETAILDGDRAKAQELYKKLDTDKEDGHTKFQDDDAPPK